MSKEGTLSYGIIGILQLVIHLSFKHEDFPGVHREEILEHTDHVVFASGVFGFLM